VCVCVCVCVCVFGCVCVCVCACELAPKTLRQHAATHYTAEKGLTAGDLQQTATLCNTLQHTITHCNKLQHTAAHCSTLQHTPPQKLQHTASHHTTRYNTLHCTATHYNTPMRKANMSALSLHVLQCVAVCCSVLQFVAVCCSVLQCVAVWCCVVLCDAVRVSPVGKAWQYATHAESSPVWVCSLLMYCSVLQCVAVCCSKCVAVYCSEYFTCGEGLAVRNKRRQFANISALSLHVLQRIAAYCSVLQRATVCCRKCVAVYFSECVTSGQGLAVRNKRRQFANIGALSLYVLQCVAVCYSVLR